jgi:Uma2 family endonuclease
MAMRATHSEWTVDMLDALPDDGNRYELIDGRLYVTPAPSDVHQLVIGALHSRLRAYLRPESVARVLMSPADVRRPDRRRNRVQPDLFVVRLVGRNRPPYPFDLADLLLAVEVESPSNQAYDHQTKRELYLSSGVPEYWIVNANARTIARWRAGEESAELVATRLVWHPDGMPSPLTIDLSELFDDALG